MTEHAADQTPDALEAADGFVKRLKPYVANTPKFTEALAEDFDAFAKAAVEKERERVVREAIEILHDEGWLGNSHRRIAALLGGQP